MNRASTGIDGSVPAVGDGRLRIVLDTNVVLDWVVFQDPGVAALVRAIESGAAIPITSNECLAELRRVLAYPAFKLDASAQEEAFERYCAKALVLDHAKALVCEKPGSSAAATLPHCSDPDDQKFLELAQAASARYLLTKDKALLELSNRTNFEILHPAGFICPV